MKTSVYIDGANLYQGTKPRWGIDYAKFLIWLQHKYKPNQIFMFLWYVKGNEKLYSYLSQCWYILIFKETLEVDGKVKGNCDAELVVQSVSDFYEKRNEQIILVTGDGDFACLVDFCLHKKMAVRICCPNRDFVSYLLRKRNVPLVYLEEIQHKIQ